MNAPNLSLIFANSVANTISAAVTRYFVTIQIIVKL